MATKALAWPDGVRLLDRFVLLILYGRDETVPLRKGV
jgi:hypothetical protein